MAPQFDDSTITAYALNELGETDRAAVAAHLGAHPVDAATVADIQQAAALLKAELTTELQSITLPPLTITPARSRTRFAAAIIGLAAATALAAGMGTYVYSISQSGRLVTAIAAQRTSSLRRDQGVKPLVSQSPSPLASSSHTEADRNKTLASLVSDARQLADESKYDEVKVVLDKIEQLDPGNTYAVNVRQYIDDRANNQIARSYTESRDVNRTQLFNSAVEHSRVDRAAKEVGSNERYAANRDPVGVFRDSRGGSSGFNSPPTADKFDTRFVTGNISGLNYFHGNGYSGHSYAPKAPNSEDYSSPADNSFSASIQSPLSTFAVDVDTASYSNVRRFIEQGQLPPPEAVRIEELINYFPYETPGPKQDDRDPIGVNVEVADCPWQSDHRLARISLKAKSLPAHQRPPSNLVFLIDVSGSMADENKLPLLKTAIVKLVARLSATDHVAIVTYAGTATTLLTSTPCGDELIDGPHDAAFSQATARLWKEKFEPMVIEKNGAPVNMVELTTAYNAEVAKLPHPKISGRQQILDAINSLNADGSTNGGDGIQMAYKSAVDSFIKDGVNRVILATDGDFNVGIVDPNQLTTLIEDKAKSGVYLTVLGLGMGNLKDAMMEKLADHGKGNYAYLDSLAEADKVLGRQIDSTLVTVAKDVKLQIEFNPATVSSYRLIGYEDRALAKEDFNNDNKTAGEMGAGHSVTALYELIPTSAVHRVEPLKYQAEPAIPTNGIATELMTVKVRYQPPGGGESIKIEVPVVDKVTKLNDSSHDFRFAAAVAEYGMILRSSPYRGQSDLRHVVDLASTAEGEDVGGYRKQFVQLVEKTIAISGYSR